MNLVSTKRVCFMNGNVTNIYCEKVTIISQNQPKNPKFNGYLVSKFKIPISKNPFDAVIEVFVSLKDSIGAFFK